MGVSRPINQTEKGFSMTRKEKAKIKRDELRSQSAGCKILVKDGAFDSINEAIVHFYSEETGESDFRSFIGWRDAGFKVKKGESSFPVWGKPKRKETEDEDNEQDQTKYWPMAYIFHSGQVERV